MSKLIHQTTKKWNHSRLIKVVVAFVVVSILILFGIKEANSMTWERAKQIHKKMQKQSGVYTKMDLMKTPEINAFASVNQIFITTGLLKFVKSDAEMAGVIGHELTHYKYRDAYFTGIDHLFELRSDREGYIHCRQAGYGTRCNDFAIHVLQEFGDIGGPGSTHPKTSLRIKLMEDLRYTYKDAPLKVPNYTLGQ